MTTLHEAPVSTVLDRLFVLDETASEAAAQTFGTLSDDERAALMSSKTAYADLYRQAKDLPLAVSCETGTLLYMLARASRASAIVEYGTSFGISTLHLAAALRDNGGGLLVGSEFEPSKVAKARANIAAAGLADLVEIREGDALQTLARDLPLSIDLVLLDGAKGLYPEILALVEPHLRRGAVIVADNAGWSPDYLARVRSPAAGYMSLPFGSDVELSIWTGRR
ncbi:MAG: class I SAM-dependent methyltransferase [Proteobacteria bacterium]|nr:class I SAM-dependent methyltransferase [Pseudomonadota bacterium]